MSLVIFKIIYYLGLAFFCLASLVALRHMNRFSYLGKAIRPVMILYIFVCLMAIIFIQLYLKTIDWDQPLFGKFIIPPLKDYGHLFTLSRKR